MNLAELIPNIGFENTMFECIDILDRNNSEVWLKTVSGFANSRVVHSMLELKIKLIH